MRRGVELGADSAAGWKALAELQYQNRQFQEAYDTAVKGLEWSVRRRRAGHETLTSFALALRLVVAQCLRRLGRLDEAEYNFKILAGEPYELHIAIAPVANIFLRPVLPWSATHEDTVCAVPAVDRWCCHA